jgi:hypothetical protein
MTPAVIIREVKAEGVRLALSPAGNIKVIGARALVNQWLNVIRDHKTEIIEVLKVGAADTATASRCWLIYYPGRDPLQVSCCPEATRAEIMEWHPGVVAAEPFALTIRQPNAPMTAIEEEAIRSWLVLIEETDPLAIFLVMDHCQRDADAREYFNERAAEARGWGLLRRRVNNV